MRFFAVFLCLSFINISDAHSTNECEPLFQESEKQPYHLSVGAVLFDCHGRIACHHFKNTYGFDEIYMLMRESMENGETPLDTLERGLGEEFGAKAQPVAFLGSLCKTITVDSSLSFEKTTLYLACKLIDCDPEERDLDDAEGQSIIEWLEPVTLISIMQQQGMQYPNRMDLDESEMIKRALPYMPVRS